MANFTAGTSFTDGVTNDVTAAKLNALVADAVPTSNLALASTTGTISNFTSSTANITLGTIPTLTAGTTTGTAGIFTSGTITTGVIPALTTGTTTSTNEVVTNGTITNLSATTSTFLGTITGSTNVVNIGSGQIYKDASGNVGVGTTSPTNKLTVYGESFLNYDGASGLLFRKLSGENRIDSYNYPITAGYPLSILASTIKLGDVSGARLTIDSSGNVGIGISPSEKLHVSGNAIITGDISQTNGATNLARNSSGAALSVTQSGAGAAATFSGGNVGIGVTTGSIAGDSGPLMVSSTSSVPILAARSGDGNVMRFYRSGTQVGSINLTSGATAYVTSSDYRLKTNLEPISNGIERVKQLPVYRFNWIANEGGNKVDGFVAHEAQAIVPECVTGEKDAVDADGKPIYQGIDQSKIVPLLTAALKEAIAKIETLEAKVTALEAA